MKKLISIFLLLAMCVTMFAACKDKEDAGLTEAAEYLFALYSKDAKTTASDYDVVGAVKVGDVTYTVEWSVNVSEDKVKIVPSEKAGMITVDVFEKTQEAFTYTLTATIKNDSGDSIVKTFEREVPKYDVTTWDAYMAAKEGDTVRVEGIVVAINSKEKGNTRNHLFLMDESGKGGYYSYQMEADPIKDLGIEVGMTVSVAGPCSPYNGMQEIKGGTATILDKTIKTFDYIDLTDKVTAETDFNQYVALPVTFKGVTLGSQDLEGSHQYLYFELNGVKMYVRSYATDFPTNLKADDKATMDADHAAHFGWKADVSGIMITYSGAPYLIPTSVTPFTNYVEVIKTPAEKVAAEKEAIKFDASYSSDAVIDLAATGKYYSDVTITWATSDATNAAIADGKLNLVIPNDAVEVTLTATITCGDVTDTKTIKIKLSKVITPIKDILAMNVTADTTDKYIVAGVVTEIKNTTYGNLYITDAEGNTLYIYGLYDTEGKRFDAMANKPAVGDYIVVNSIVSVYQGTIQLKNATVTSITNPSTIPEVTTIGSALTGDTTEKYLVTGVVDEIANTTYGNLYIKDEAGNKFYVYGVYSENGALRFDAMTKKPAVGDTITVYGILSIYKSEPQFKNAWVVVLTPKAAEGGDTETDAPAGDAPAGGDNAGTTTPPAGDTPAAGTVKVVVSEYATTNSWVDGNSGSAYGEMKLNNDITATATGTAVGSYALNTGKYYSSNGTWRFYQTESGTLTIKAAAGKTITSVKITYSVKNTGVLMNGTAQVASDAVVNVNANSITLTVGQTGTATNGQVQITAIEVIYA